MTIIGGYYLKARKIEGSEIMHASPHIREIFDYLIRKSNHTETPSHGRIIKRGQCFVRYNDIQEALHWFIGYRKHVYSKHKVETAMKWYKKRDMITTTKTTRGLIVTICNYGYYQNCKNYENHKENHNETTMKPQDTDTINKNGKKCKNEIKILVSELKNSNELYEKITYSYWQLFNSNLNKFEINSTDLKKAKAKNWITNIRLMMENDNRTHNEILEVFDFLKNNEFWAKNILSTAKLREKFETLLIQARTNENNSHNSNPITSAKDTHERVKQTLKKMRYEN